MVIIYIIYVIGGITGLFFLLALIGQIDAPPSSPAQFLKPRFRQTRNGFVNQDSRLTLEEWCLQEEDMRRMW